jgi:hypothetical protein
MNDHGPLIELLAEAQRLFDGVPQFDDYATGVGGWRADVRAWTSKYRALLATYPPESPAIAEALAAVAPPVAAPAPVTAPKPKAFLGGCLDCLKP